jgi:hypothetical protein
MRLQARTRRCTQKPGRVPTGRLCPRHVVPLPILAFIIQRQLMPIRSPPRPRRVTPKLVPTPSQIPVPPFPEIIWLPPSCPWHIHMRTAVRVLGCTIYPVVAPLVSRRTITVFSHEYIWTARGENVFPATSGSFALSIRGPDEGHAAVLAG